MVRDLVTPFAQFAAGAPRDDLVARWREQVVEPDAGLYAAIRSWVDPRDAAARLPALVDRRAELLDRADQARIALSEAETVLTRSMGGQGAITAVIIVGLGGANGWVTVLDGEPVLFLAVDQLPRAGFDVVLAMHEMIHLIHRRRADREWPADRVDLDLLREGLAVFGTARLLPAAGPSAHLWFTDGHEGWIDRCRAAQPTLWRQLLRDLERTDVAHRWFSGAVDRAGELPGRCGYWLGWRLLDHLVGRGPLDSALDWTLAEAASRVRHGVSDLVRAHPPGR